MRKQDKGFTLIELMIVVTIIGILAVVAGPELMKYQVRAKTSEAIQNVAKVADGAKAYYLEEQTSRGLGNNLNQKQFPQSIGPTPQEMACQGNSPQKHNPTDFSTPETFGHESWQSLQFGVSKPFLFSYTFLAQGQGQAATFSARAEGDLDCDGANSLFEQSGEVDANNQIVVHQLYRRNPLE
jgi:prepilin-type N-terminal cleavage/methylation domain-containing protein